MKQATQNSMDNGYVKMVHNGNLFTLFGIKAAAWLSRTIIAENWQYFPLTNWSTVASQYCVLTLTLSNIDSVQ